MRTGAQLARTEAAATVSEPYMIGYHGTPMRDLGHVLAEGLVRAKADAWGCQHGGCISIASTPEIAAKFVQGCGRILVVDLDGLAGLSDFHGGEAKVHGDIPPNRISLYDGPPVVPSLAGHIDPGKTPLGNHPACVHPSRLEPRATTCIGSIENAGGL